MSRASTWLLDHAGNVHSQYGEDGILAKVLEILPDNDRWCVEFGAWDGRHLSNTCHLIENSGYSAVLIEGDQGRADALAREHAGNGQIHTVNRFVGFTPGDNLDTILAETPVPTDFDLLSIDIDGNDYHVWSCTSRYRPKVVCIEFNPTIPTEVEFVQQPAADVTQGCSLKALANLGHDKGYELVGVTHCNAIFVREEYFSLFEIADNSPHALRADSSAVTWIFSGFDGRIILQGGRHLPWHNVSIDESQVQQIPRVFRRYPGSLGRVNRTLFKAWKHLRQFGRGQRAA